eukprot:82710-Pyramimonas_sp.AAC.1
MNECVNSQDGRALESLYVPFSGEELRWWPVTVEMSSVRSIDGPECCRPAQRAATKHAGSLAALFRKRAGPGEPLDSARARRGPLDSARAR